MTEEREKEIRVWTAKDINHCYFCVELLAEIDRLRAEKNKFDEECRHYMAVADRLEDERDALRAENEQLIARDSDKLSLYATVLKQRDHLRSELEKLHVEMASWDGERNELKSRIEKLRSCLSDYVCHPCDSGEGECYEYRACKALKADKESGEK